MEGVERVQWIVVPIVHRHFGVVTRWLECKLHQREKMEELKAQDFAFMLSEAGSHFVDEKTGLDPRVGEKNKR